MKNTAGKSANWRPNKFCLNWCGLRTSQPIGVILDLIYRVYAFSIRLSSQCNKWCSEVVVNSPGKGRQCCLDIHRNQVKGLHTPHRTKGWLGTEWRRSGPEWRYNQWSMTMWEWWWLIRIRVIAVTPLNYLGWYTWQANLYKIYLTGWPMRSIPEMLTQK